MRPDLGLVVTALAAAAASFALSWRLRGVLLQRSADDLARGLRGQLASRDCELQAARTRERDLERRLTSAETELRHARALLEAEMDRAPRPLAHR